ncbi:MAG TPA: FkbM family methyltransferase [Thermoanaerobaculia bacterium]|jgi:FkbM family methyltransferase|nr:FkbM family methyltransferase [Thermoanaerobaculia bacterium]
MRDRIIASYLRGPEHPAKLRVIRALSSTIIPESGIIAAVPGVPSDLRLFLHPRDWIEYLLLRGTAYEPRTLAFIRLNLHSGQGAIFAGVNFGLHVASAALATGPQGLILGVEPQPAALLRARMNFELNGLESRVVLVAAALGAEEGLAHMAWSKPDNPGAASLLDQSPGFTVPMIRLRSLMPLLGGRLFRLLLLDVQGFEQEALKGIDFTQGPEIAVIEIDREFVSRAGVSPETLAHTLTEAGYNLFTIDGEDPDQRWFDLPELNLVAVREGAEVCWGSGLKP